jgi:hypothetical protein
MKGPLAESAEAHHHNPANRKRGGSDQERCFKRRQHPAVTHGGGLIPKQASMPDPAGVSLCVWGA